MPTEMNGQTYYRTSEVCAMTGISRATLFRWLKTGILKEWYRDRRGWRIFTKNDIEVLKREATRVSLEKTREGAN